MKADAIFKVTEALRGRLEQAAREADPSASVFVGPLDDPDAKGASLILFLYRIVPNASLRNQDHVVVSDQPPPGTMVAFPNSLPLVLHYLVTIGSRDGDGTDPLLRLLGHAIRALNMDAELTGVKVGHETVQVSIEPLSTEEMSRVWTLFPTANYRTSVGYVASPVWLDPDQPPTAAGRVVDNRLAAGPRAREAENA